MNKKIIAILLLIALTMFSMSLVKVKAEIVFDNSTMTVLENAEESCFKDSSQGLLNYNLEIQPNSKCVNVNFTSPPTYCQRVIRIRNPSASAFPIAVQVIPIPDNLPCPAPTYTNNKVSIRFLPSADSNRAQFNYLDLNECWNWWCSNTTYSIEKRCPFGWSGLQYLGVLGGCYDVNVTIGNPIEKCPYATFTAQGEDDYIDVRMSWVNNPPNDVDVPYILKIKGYKTVYDTQLTQNYEQTILSEGATNYVAGLETIVGINVSFLEILYMIFEISAIIIAVIGLPALVIMLIKWVWSAVTGRPFGWRTRR